MVLFRRLTLLFAMLAPACATSQEARIVLLGDSTMAWNNGEVARTMSHVLGEAVRDESIGGARLSHPFALFVGPMDIRSQLPRLPFEWVIVAAGANDLAAECDCNACGGVLDQLITEDALLGQIPDFVQEATLRGSRMLWAQYYDTPVGGGPFGACADEIAVLDARLERLARMETGFHLADMSAVVEPNNPDHYDPDRVHPSVEGSQLIGQMLATRLRALFAK